MSPRTQSFQDILDALEDRQREVVIRRFGFKGSENRETLEAIGERFGVTRERVRQIEAAALQAAGTVAASHKGIERVLREGKKHLKSAGGIMRKEQLVSKLVKVERGITEGHLEFLLKAREEFYSHAGDEHLHPFFFLGKSSLGRATSFLKQWIETLKSRKDGVLEGQYEKEFRKFIKKKKMNPIHAEHYVSISRKILENPYGYKGLREWPEVRPKTIRDRIYVTLRHHKEPVHFEDIAKLINKAEFDRKKAIPSTVHNELIKDARFVLVGRGTYGLKEYGHEPGTAKEVIQRILKEQGPLASRDIIQAVQKKRLFKPNTILVNLQNKDLFKRGDDGKYQVREA